MQYVQDMYIIFTALFGLVFGSFLNVCIYRFKNGESIVFGRSHCMSCGSKIEERDLIPIFSYILLRGRCRSCGAKISPRYALVEALNTLLWVAALCAFGITPKAFISMAFISGIIVVSFIDIDSNLVPRNPVLFIFAIGVISCFVENNMPFYDNILGAVAAGAPLLIILLVSRGGMGMGDVEFAAAAGLLLGWELSLIALFAAIVTGGFFGAILMIFAKKSRKFEMPFVPFLAAGMLIAMFFGNYIINFYARLV